ncbi:MAG: dienelactone hydrolase family protein [Desulfuromonadales bacterium]|nr:dienelactone hydrolase family protein [Desulfuromonadales bacterium]NIR33072.1 dienelactone hydrolase family protein [Desulfuromonadales bacterium]NIS39310.1 dienelactone hydrolase family protein [Desulfuromonadales bacterium]
MMRYLSIGLALVPLLLSAAHAEVRGKEIEYSQNGTEMHGYLAYQTTQNGKRPGVLVVHEWWGHNDYARTRAEMLAGLGYTALALDMYGEGRQASHPKEAGKFAGKLKKDLPLAKKRFQAALEVLEKHPTVDQQRVAAIGYCFGGGIVLEMARAGIDLDAVVSFHGSLATDNPAEAGEVEARVLVLNGAEDPFVTEEQIAAFKKEMQRAEVDYTFVNLPGATHSFTNPAADRLGEKFDLPLAYNAKSDTRSWQIMKDFLAETFSR